MSQVVINMKMPEGCSKCPFYEDGERHWEEGRYGDKIKPSGYCWAGRFCLYGGVFGIAGMDDGDCPLIELPPHGDLIDRDKLEIKDEWSLVGTDVIWDAPAVLEANT